MKQLKHVTGSALLFLFCYSCFVSCSNETTTKTTTTKTDSVKKVVWADPQKGKIWGKVNIVQIPLTAYEEHILGNVKSVSYKDYKLSENPDSAKVLTDSGYNVYDKAGHLVDQNEYKADGTAKWKCIYKYDDKNNAVEWDFKFENAKQNSVTTFKYDDKGRKIESIEVAAEKDRSRRVVYKYDDKGNEVEEAEYEGNGKKPWLTQYKYDERGFQVEYVHRDETGRVLMKRTVEYDNNGDKTGGVYYASDTEIKGKSTAKLNAMGRTTETSYFKKDGSLISKTTFKYDDGDNITEIVSYKPDGSIDTAGFNMYSDYEYDAKGNIIKETQYKMKDGKRVATSLTETVYTYY